MGKRNKENLLWLDSWDDAMEALATTHTISLSQVCELMKASRPWVNKYIRPNVSAIYISTWPGKDGWPVTWRASRALGKEIKDSIWMDKEKLFEYLESCVVSCTAQTKLLPYEKMVPESQRGKFLQEMQVVIDGLYKAFDEHTPTDDLWARRDHIIETYITGSMEKELIDAANRPSGLGTGRTRIPASPVPRPPVRNVCNRWYTIADARGYGGVDEMIYRDLFLQGAHRMELQFNSPEGVGRKIYYFPDPEPYRETVEALNDRIDRSCLVALVQRRLYDAWREQTQT